MSRKTKKGTTPSPQIYAYRDDRYPGLLKVGYTTRKNVLTRIKEQYPILAPTDTPSYHLCLTEPAVTETGAIFTDKEVHRRLEQQGIVRLNGEWFQCSPEVVQAVVVGLQTGSLNTEQRTQTFDMRPEQAEAVAKTKAYFTTHPVPSRFLWNAKMRFGKTFATYQLAKQMGWTRVLILTYKPAVESSWRQDLLTHVAFDGWQFTTPTTDVNEYASLDLMRPVVCFGSFQDLLGKTEAGEGKAKHQWIRETTWDVIVVDEYHFGAWREMAKELYEDTEIESPVDATSDEESDLSLSSSYRLYLSGTPFRALQCGEFSDEQVYHWTYGDEQAAKQQWVGEQNPYEALPTLQLWTYRLPDYLRQIALKGEWNEFDLSEFFKATGEGNEARFAHPNEVQAWLDLIRGQDTSTVEASLQDPTMFHWFPFEHPDLKSQLAHTLWFLPNVSSCLAMKHLLAQPQNRFYHAFTVVVAAGEKAGVGVKALPPVRRAMKNPLQTQTITLTCGKLTTGVTVNPWTGIFMLRNLNSAETYFQAAFRVQSPWVIPTEEGVHLLKPDAYIFDFAPDRALKQIVSYAEQLGDSSNPPHVNVERFIKFLPVLAYDGFGMEAVDAAGLLDLAMGQTTATLLAKGWGQQALLRFDPTTLSRLAEDVEAITVLNRLTATPFRENPEVVVNRNRELQALKTKERQTGTLPSSDSKKKRALEEEQRLHRQQLLDKFKTLLTRLPVFLYLSEAKETALRDILTPDELELFYHVTGVHPEEFHHFAELGLFNESLMNHLVYEFDRYETASDWDEEALDASSH